MIVIDYKIKNASQKDLHLHLEKCNYLFLPPLSDKVNLQEYSQKIHEKSQTFEAWHEKKLVGFIAVYFNDSQAKKGYITNVSVLENYNNKGIASQLIKMTKEYAQNNDFTKIILEVHSKNNNVIALYKKHDFEIEHEEKEALFMEFRIKNNSMNIQRDYNQELKDTANHKYAYNFDFDVMHPFMLKSFIPFFKEGNLLELGSFKGDFTRKFLPYFDDITCVEASDDAVAIAKAEFGDKVKVVNSLFETVMLPTKYDNIVLTHVLEHINDPIAVLKRINDEWLSDNGRFFLVCPNANAPSRQIAVKMGLITHNAAITSAEAEHGHHITYTLDTLERDAKAAGLKVVYRSGIFFKALANFQWDRLLQTDIISNEYLEGCYQLGQHYPDLCSSIFLMCEKGE
ncbi:GNAT family N-acetyltransferase [Flavobacterium sp. WC2421]|uniref:GNAT family N-acetyltransferase n=1 Tax=Flavobacterium sp. WC2421 TaxID=3234138 RepID=UPI003465DA4D